MKKVILLFIICITAAILVDCNSSDGGTDQIVSWLNSNPNKVDTMHIETVPCSIPELMAAGWDTTKVLIILPHNLRP